jgi:hypothetical protein
LLLLYNRAVVGKSISSTKDSDRFAKIIVELSSAEVILGSFLVRVRVHA